MDRTIIAVDMDAFYASVEIRDNPELAGKPLIIGALPHERGVVSTCSYEARKYGVRSAMSIKDAYRRCPNGIYMHPNFHKYEEASHQIHEIWSQYTDVYEYISLDEAFLDVTHTAHLFGGARKIGHDIKAGVKSRTRLTCSVGIGYSMMSAKLASEEKKPDGFFEIPTPEFLTDLIIDRNVRVVYGIGAQTAEQLQKAGIITVRDIYNNKARVEGLLGNYGKQLIELAEGIDNRIVAHQPKSKSLGKEITFQHDTVDYDYLKDVLRLLAKELSFDIRSKEIFCRTVTLKITYGDMKKITRSKSGDATNKANDIYTTVAALLDSIEKRAVRLVGISLSGFTDVDARQLSLFTTRQDLQSDKLDRAMLALQHKYGADIIKTGSELDAEQKLASEKSNLENEFNRG
jgi:DNA polymerase-4/DNA polymerase IV (DinB-like DNA polymerase)